MAPGESSRPSSHRPRDSSGRKHHNKKRRSRAEGSRRPATDSGESRDERRSQSLSVDALAKLDQDNVKRQKRREKKERSAGAGRPSRDANADADAERRERRRARREAAYRDAPTERPKRVRREVDTEAVYEKPRREHKNKKKRVVSGAIMEEGRSRGHLRGGGWNSSDHSFEKEYLMEDPPKPVKKRKKLWICLSVSLVLLIIIIVVAVVVSKNNNKSSNTKTTLDDGNKDSVPMKWRGTYLDPWSWDDTTDFNVTFTEQMVGDLPVMGLYTDWDDSKRANDKVPALKDAWGSYGSRPARGVNVGGWLNLEPFITPSLFNYDSRLGIIDEYTLCKHLGTKQTAEVLEKHYSTFVTESTFKEIADAGLDHVRIPFNYWAVEVYDGDPYLFRTSWRYLLRGIEWARKYGLRVNLDVHGLPGSQNGWNHSGRQGAIGWLNGTDGATNAQRSLDMHDRLSKFFAQDRYKNIIAFYGLANEPRNVDLNNADVVSWTAQAYKLVKGNGIGGVVVFGDGFMGLANWQGKLTGYSDLALDVHQYVIFNTDQIVYTHKKKVEYACSGWTEQTEQSMDTSTGYGPTLFAEWSQADTDCAKHLTNVGWGNRWTGTYNTGNATTSILEPRCPTQDSKCDCDTANGDAGGFSSDYKKFLQMFAEAQMHSFEKGWGWWYWTWDTESAPLWSYKKGLAAGILPAKAYDRDFDCSGTVPDFGSLAETYRM
ncbi:beta-glucosidase 6 [Colletotrichum paranaense]|uniref:glucan 1,3-beta-glucosidase n=4 Tax=Colletotrichum acutatum species complex TaxID=2707335 RepID=A0A9Q8W8S1_9PEZI|nr:beta-glucosidase 6 [Colletotrichum lupini]XP_060344468.1 beta-glucosidase 6 [Colletotrichum paranaense]KAK0377747.1 beta-glucosidase 6 [Colletotrichum limetticola]KAK1463442.1 beta-glucosidase 6 [Colletotrichum melonis]KAK1528122.1 beta-glucosidase 6 [Colletotrichum paranaense]UQC73792.1 beta-glucosidase 6 [Colletotrichum lupini]